MRAHWLRHTFQVWSHHFWLKGMLMKMVCVCFAHVINLHISPSSLMSHPSLCAPSLLVPHGQHDWSAAPDFLSGVSRPKVAGHAHSDIGDQEFGYLATSTHITGYEPKQSDRMITADDDATPINDPDHDSICDFSQTHTRQHWMVWCSHGM